jgi:lysophospholipase L1-like esterase
MALSLFVLLVLVVLDVLLGSLLTAVGANPALTWPDVSFRIKHPVYHHTFRSMVSEPAQWGALRHTIHINSLGFKDASPREVALASEGERIVIIGDSFTEGIGIPYEQTFAGLIAEALAPRGIEVLNAGVATYAASIYLRKVEFLLNDVGLGFDRLWVFIDMSDLYDDYYSYQLDDERNVIRPLDRSPQMRATRFFVRQTVGISSLIGLFGRIRVPAGSSDEGATSDQRWVLWSGDDAVWEEFGREGMEISKGHMAELSRLLAARGIPLTIIVYPWPDQILRSQLDSRQAVHWREFAAAHGADFVDLHPAFMRDPDPRQATNRYFIPGDSHWNEAGHALVAREVLATVMPERQEGAAPASAR